MDIVAFKDLFRLRDLLAHVNDPVQLGSQAYILSDRQTGDQVVFLVNDLHTVLSCFKRRHMFEGLSVNFDSAFVVSYCSGQDLDQSGFTRAVLTQKSVYLSLQHIEIYLIECDNTRIEL